jgi:hypothetical protein
MVEQRVLVPFAATGSKLGLDEGFDRSIQEFNLMFTVPTARGQVKKELDVWRLRH